MLGPLTQAGCLQIQGLSKRRVGMQEAGTWKLRGFCSELESFLQNQELKVMSCGNRGNDGAFGN